MSVNIAKLNGFGRSEAVVFATCQQKGGVGKTFVSLGVADRFEQMGYRVLMLDLDPQANLTEALQPDARPELTINDVLVGDRSRGGEVIPGSMRDAISEAGPQWGSMRYVPAELALAAREQDQLLGREFRIREALDGAKGDYDVVLIDCPPSLGQLTISSLVAADYALLVTEPRAASVQGLAEMTGTLASVRKHFNPSLRTAGIIVNRHRESSSDRREQLGYLREDYGERILEPILHEREVVPQAYSAARPLSSFKSKSKDITGPLGELTDQIIATVRKDAKS